MQVSKHGGVWNLTLEFVVRLDLLLSLLITLLSHRS